MKRKGVRLSHERPSFQIFIVIWVTFCLAFSFLSIWITFINSMKTDYEVAYNVFSLPSSQIFSAIATNYSKAWNEIYPYFLRSILSSLLCGFFVTLFAAILAYILVFKDFYFKHLFFMFFISILLVPSIIGFPTLLPLIRDTFNLGDTIFGYTLPTIGGAWVMGMFLFRTFFFQQPKAIYESAKLDGANDIQIFLRITIPLALPIMLYYAIGIFSSEYNDYLWASLVLDNKLTLMPKMYSLVDSNTLTYGAMYAMYMLSSVPLVITTVISMHYFRSGEFSSGMKL